VSHIVQPFANYKRLGVMLVVLCACANSLGWSQTISHTVSASAAAVEATGSKEILGQVILAANPSGGGTQITQASSLRFWYEGVPITNRFEGALSANPATGLISHPDGITVQLSGGYVSAAVNATVSNTLVNDALTGILTLNLPGGLAISAGDAIRISGIRASILGKVEGDGIRCLFTAFPSNSHLLSVGFATVGLVVDHSLRILSPGSLPDGLLGTAYLQTLLATGGTPPYTWRLTAGSLSNIPLFLNAVSGVLSGGPTQGGRFTFTIEVCDSQKAMAKRDFTLSVQGISLDHGGLHFGEAAVGTSVTDTITVSNVGTAGQDVTVGRNGSAAFTIAPSFLSLEAGQSQLLHVTFTPPDDNNGLEFAGEVLVQSQGVRRIVSLTGRGHSSTSPVFSVRPISGPTTGNTRVRVRGTGLVAVSDISLGGVSLSNLTRTAEDEWMGVTRPHSAELADLTIVLSDGAVITVPDSYDYRQLAKATPSPGDLRIRFVSDTPEFRSNLGINNVGNQPASVSIALVENNGLVVARKTASVAANGMTQINNILRYLEDSDDTTGREGYLWLTANQPIRAWASQIDSASLDPSLQSATAETSSHLLVPSSVANDRFRTALLIASASAADGSVSLIARNPSGIVQATLSNLSLPGFGFLYFEDLYGSLGLDSVSGPVEVTAQGDLQLMALARIYSREQTGGFLNAVPAERAGREIYIPHLIDTVQLRTNLGLNNPGSTVANVTFSLLSRGGLVIGSLSDLVPAGALVQWDDVIRSLLGSSSRTGQEGWLRVQSDQDIVAWVSQINNTSQDPDFLVGTVPSSGRLLIPSVVSAGRYHSTLVLVNADSAPNSISVTARGTDGTTRRTTILTIPGNGWVSYDDVLSSLGLAGTFGPLELVSTLNKPILAVSRVINDDRTSGLFEAVPLPSAP
jgi:ASPM-SPD-2-Hydin domain-containing protein